MEILYLLIGLVLGGLCVFFVMRGQWRSVNAILNAERTARIEAKNDAAELLAMTKREAVEALASQKVENERQRGRELEDLKQSYRQQLDLLWAQLGNMGEKMLKERSEELQNSNRMQMESLFNPIRENLKRMEQAMNDANINTARNTSELRTSIAHMMEQTMALGKEADRLSNALQQNNKVTGEWGELILNELLESQGLQKGIHFDVQETMRDEQGNALKNEDSGARMRPDVILHLDDNRDVIIDSKMSLKAFVDYQNAQTDEEKEEAMKRHLDSVNRHVDELSRKNYSKYIQKNRVQMDFVIMFVPIEGALQLAMARDGGLWRRAFDRKVFIAGAQTLIAALRIIDLTWVNLQQERNTQKILDEARKLVDRVVQFQEKLVSLGNKIGEVEELYKEIKNKAVDGQQSIVGAGRRLENLGVRGKKALPREEGDI